MNIMRESGRQTVVWPQGLTILVTVSLLGALCGHAAEIRFVQEYRYPTEFTVTPIQAGGVAGAAGADAIIGVVVEPSGFETREVGVVMSVEAYVADLAGGNAALLSLQQNMQDAGNTPLMIAAASGDADRVRQLLRRPADINGKNKFGSTALMGAAAGGYEDVVAMLLKRKAQVNMRSKNGANALIFAAKNGHAGVVAMLLKRGAKHNVPDNVGATPLMYSVANGHTGVVRLLLAAGANINYRNRHGMTPLKLAQETEDKELVALLTRSGARKI